MNKGLALLLGLLLVLSACKRDLIPSSSSAVDIEKFQIAELDFDYLTAKTKIKYTDPANSTSATANIRMRKDSLIWFSMTPALGIEAARGIVTQDSMVIIDRINKRYSIYSFESLSKKFKVNLNYGIVEALILGNSIQPVTSQDKVNLEGSAYRLQQRNGPMIINQLITGGTNKVEKVEMTDELIPDNSLTINYGEYQLAEELIYPSKVLISLNYKDKSTDRLLNTQVDLEHNRLQIESKTLKFPFNIPSKYERIQ